VPAPAGGQQPTAMPAKRIVPLYPGATTTTTRPPLPVDSREQLVHLLTQAAELEQGILCEDLFALYSLKRDPRDGLGGEQLEQVTRWGRTLSDSCTWSVPTTLTSTMPSSSRWCASADR
jgi:hypothetical protein